jgi:hypothetical protein
LLNEPLCPYEHWAYLLLNKKTKPRLQRLSPRLAASLAMSAPDAISIDAEVEHFLQQVAEVRGASLRARRVSSRLSLTKSTID